MSNELKDIAERLNRYSDDNGWQIESASKRADGGWDLIIQPMGKDTKEAGNDND
jgi:hypothetical protein